jgi:hypothetical protein
VALEKPDFTRNGVRNGLQNVEKLQNFIPFTLGAVDLFL